MSRWGAVGACITALALVVGAPASAAPAPPTKYTLAGNCYPIHGPAGKTGKGASQLRMQATRLASHLLDRTDQTVLAVHRP